MNEDHRRYTVLVNDAEQYALHPEAARVPGGWRPAGFSGDENACARHVDERWTDMRPPQARR
ncbi:MbtH family NRPS accessory protein [Rhizohabitans arisaemae]|uniref:MbtH family NRPS accessory protein n=1 Tax=Rhizohabitans arisaemae TaxID=2720610 RepID=UPI0024B04DD3|nr:MbtH family NRPS accessory protein [Rhizohabitans arisaemae]